MELIMVGLGVFLHAVGGFAAGSFYLPLKKVRAWSWESGWLVNGFFSWIISPMVVALLTVPELFGAILSAPPAIPFQPLPSGLIGPVRIMVFKNE
jgi:hypothetical protein